MNISEIITIGDELLIGQTVDTNSAWIGSELSLIGIKVNRITSISDRSDEIINALNEALNRADVVLITGGLGPTSDDITKQTLCEFFNAEMIQNEEVLAEVSERLRKRNFPLNVNNQRQAMVPDKCTVLMNREGTAPGMLFRKEKKLVISMPGVPHEMKYIMKEHVLPLLSETMTGQVIIHKNIMTFGLPEAVVAEKLELFEKELPPEIKLAYLPAQGIIKLRLTATGTSEASIRDIIEKQVGKLYDIIPDIIYGEDEVTLEEAVGNLLSNKHLTLATAESCTGGMIASLITSVPGSSGWYTGSVVAYDNKIKTELLGVSSKTLNKHGAVSAETAKEMAAGAKSALRTDFAVAVTGIAGPAGGTVNKPVGTVWIAVADKSGVIAEKYTFGDNRNINISRSAFCALNLLRKQIIRH